MRKRALILAVLSLAAVTASVAALRDHPAPHRDMPGALSEREHEGGGKTLIAFGSMYGVDGPFVGEAFAIRDIPGDELPWEVRSARGRVDTDGHVTLRIRGLVFKDEEGVPEELRGINDESEFRVAISCLTEEGDAVTTANVVTGGFPATRSGDSVIRTTVELPNPCLAPIVMVLAGSEDKWFAVTGFESEEDEE
ncbi:MAG TPA: hypothetical protein VJ826_10735 [Candidatus Polarisedimenticolaceae bacterium]|nr:hypothetical protein [Candidatus Polarisedimenticolaceae bacterium]